MTQQTIDELKAAEDGVRSCKVSLRASEEHLKALQRACNHRNTLGMLDFVPNSIEQCNICGCYPSDEELKLSNPNPSFSDPFFCGQDSGWFINGGGKYHGPFPTGQEAQTWKNQQQ